MRQTEYTPGIRGFYKFPFIVGYFPICHNVMNQEGGSLQTAPYLAITATSAPRRGHSGGKRGSRRSWGKCFMEGGGTQYPIFNVQYPITNGRSVRGARSGGRGRRGEAGKQEITGTQEGGRGRRTEGKGGSSFAKATADKEGGIQYPIFNVQYPMSRSPFPNLGGFASWRETDLQARPRPARRSWNISDMRAGMACGDMAIRVALVRHEGVISVDANKREIWS